jgi:signal transduction histidine kinase
MPVVPQEDSWSPSREYDAEMRPPAFDMVLAGSLALASVVSLTVQDAGPAMAAAQAVAALSLAFRRTAPLVPPVVLLVASAWMLAAGRGPDDIFFLVIWIVGSYGSGAYLPWPSTAGALGLWWAALLLAEGAGLEWGDVVFLGALTTSAWVPGVLAFRSRAARDASAALSELRTAQAARAVTDERARIARELHDVVAHAVGIMVVQAGAAERVMGSNPLQAQRALRAVQDTGRTAVAELTRLLGLLRAEDADQLAPLPSVAGLAELCDRVTQAGVSVTVDLVGDLTALPPVVDLNVYRVVQEALTNAVKHAPGTHVQVRVRRSGPLIDVEVTDDGPHGAHALDEGGRGLGLIGLRERVSVFGGQLDAGPGSDGGFRVAVRLPVTPAVP